MRKGLLVLAVLALAGSTWAGMPMIGGMASVEHISPPRGESAFHPTDTLQYHTMLRSTSNYYIVQGNNTLLYSATRFTPPYSGAVDSALVFIYAAAAFPSAITETLFFYKDTTLTDRQPGTLLSSYTFSFTPTQRAIVILKYRLGTAPFPVTGGTDFWSGTVGLQRAPNSPDSLRNTMDTTRTTVADRQYLGEPGRALLDWRQCSNAGLPFDWGISLFLNQGSGVELLTPGGLVSLPPRIWASPNPFRGSGEIAFDLPKAARVELTVHDLAGRLVKTLVVGETSAGHHSVRWDGKDAQGRPVASGVYIYTLRAGSLSATRSLVVVR